MEASSLHALSSECEGIKVQAEDILKDIANIEIAIVKNKGAGYDYSERTDKTLEIMTRNYLNQGNALANTYKHAKALAKQLGYDMPSMEGKAGRPFLREMIAACEGAIGFATRGIGSLPPDQQDKLNHIREEIDQVCDPLDLHFKKNIQLATEHLERGDFLGSALVSARVIAHVVDQIQGQSIEQKLSNLEKSGKLETDSEGTKQAIIKANKKSRNILSHRIDVFADASDATSLLGDCLTVLKVYAIQTN